MRVLVQRVNAASVTVAGQVVGHIGRGLTLLVGVAPTDTPAELIWMARKCLELRLFPALEGAGWDYSVQDIQGEILVVSQFTLYGDCRKGRRPSFDRAAPPTSAEPRYNEFVALLRASGLRLKPGSLGP